MDVSILTQIEAVGSKLTKVALLKQLKEDTLRILKQALDPMVTFGITVDEDVSRGAWLASPRDPMSHDLFSDGVHALLICLKNRIITGNKALEEFDALVLRAPTLEHVKWFSRVVNKNLRAGFSSSSLNKAHPGTIKEFEVALATPFDPDKHELVGAYHVEPKLDGLRMVIIGNKAFTRNGRSIETVQHIVDELKSQFNPMDEWVIDGEIMGAGDFDEASGDIRRKSTGANEELYYNIFDMMTLTEWNERKTPPLVDRRFRLEHMIKPSKNIKIVRSQVVHFNTPATAIVLSALCDGMIAEGYEGAMVKDATAEYVWDRSKAMLKVKKFETEDMEIVGTYDGRGKYKGKLGGVIVTRNGVTTKVGSGFSDEQREMIPEALIGRIAEVQYQNLTPDGKLRFPSFIRFRGDKE